MLGRGWHAAIRRPRLRRDGVADQSNLLSGIVSAQLAVRPDRDGPAWRALRLAALFGITVTGIVYSTVLAAIHEPSGVTETTVNLIVHYIVPIMMVAGWFAFGPRPRAGPAVTKDPRAQTWPGPDEMALPAGPAARQHGTRADPAEAGLGNPNFAIQRVVAWRTSLSDC